MFTRVTACTLALSPIRDTLIEGFSHFVTSMTAPIASGGLTSVDGILKAQLYGYLAAIMACAEGEPHLKTGTSRSTGPETLLSAVAGAGFEPATFRL